jgi:hypothetical protein
MMWMNFTRIEKPVRPPRPPTRIMKEHDIKVGWYCIKHNCEYIPGETGGTPCDCILYWHANEVNS